VAVLPFDADAGGAQVVEADGGVLGQQRTRVVDPGYGTIALDEEAAAG
jgi:hypothetical protein